MPPGLIIPELAYPEVESAAEWLCKAFGFRPRLQIGDHRFQLTFGEASIVVTKLTSAAPGQGQPTHSVMVSVADVDAHYQHTLAAGAKILMAPQTFPFGERQYSAEDPGGHRWVFTQSVADIDPADWGGQLKQ